MDMSPEGIRQMRLKITMTKHRGDRIQADAERWTATPVASLTRAILYTAERNGLSGEDAMTVLAYHALVEWEKLFDKALSDLVLSPDTRMFLDPSAPAGDAPTRPKS